VTGQNGGSFDSSRELRYDKMVENALRNVVRQALDEVADEGLPGQHHFYITFRTDHPKTDVPAHLTAQYPETMTIVLQHQFWNLYTDDDGFSVTLSFNKKPQPLRVPWAALQAFADPSVNFALQFEVLYPEQLGQTEDLHNADLLQPEKPKMSVVAVETLKTGPQPPVKNESSSLRSKTKAPEAKGEAGDTGDIGPDETPKTGEVVSFDQFRKK